MARPLFWVLVGFTAFLFLYETVTVFRNRQRNCALGSGCSMVVENQPPENSSSAIIFLETTGTGRLTARTSCAVESAARHHPQHSVLLLYHGKEIPQDNPFLRLLDELPNVRLRKENLQVAFADTPLASWFASNSLSRSRFHAIHLSDALRLALVYKLGGTYLDTDVVVLKPLDELKNCVSRSLEDMVANGFLVFDQGHPFLLRCMTELARNYDPEEWGTNGPILLRRVLLPQCNASSVGDIVGKTCGGVTVLPQRFLLPLNYTLWYCYFQPARAAYVWKELRDSYVMHVFGKLSRNVRVEPRDGSAYEQAARLHCPTSFQTAVKRNGYF